MIAPAVLPDKVAEGGPGWRTNRALRGVIAGLGALMVLAAVLTIVTGPEEWIAGATVAAVGLWVLAAGMAGSGWLRQPGSSRPFRTTHDDEPATAIPCRPLPLLIVLPLALIGAVLLLGGMAGGAILLSSGDTGAGLLILIAPTLMGAVLLLLGAANLLPKSRSPEPLLLTTRGLGWVHAGQRHWTDWVDIAAVEQWWTRVGVRLPRLRANLVLLRSHDGEPLAAFYASRLDTDPQLALQTIEDHHARYAALGHGGE